MKFTDREKALIEHFIMVSIAFAQHKEKINKKLVNFDKLMANTLALRRRIYEHHVVVFKDYIADNELNEEHFIKCNCNQFNELYDAIIERKREKK